MTDTPPPSVSGKLTGETITSAWNTYQIRWPCQAAAPLVLNGGAFAGCSLDHGHEGFHQFMVRWQS